MDFVNIFLKTYWSIEDIQIGEKIYVLAIYFNLTTSSVLNTLFSPFLEHCMLWILIAIVLFVITRVCTMYLICDFCLFINTISKYGNVTIFYTEIMIRKVKLLSFYRHNIRYFTYEEKIQITKHK